MPRRARYAAGGALAGILAMALTWLLAHHVAAIRQADADVLQGFLGLHRPHLNELTTAIARLCDPVPFVFLAMVPVVVALVRGRPRVALAVALLLLGANETTQLLKPLLGGPRDPVAGVVLTGSTWPSGHATASMSLALAMVIAAPARLRPRVGALMAAFSVAVCWSFLELGWHYPSDVLGGYEVASVWTLGTLSLLWTYEAHRPRLARRAAGRRTAPSLGGDLAPPAVVAAIAGTLGLAIAATRPHAVLDYIAGHETFLAGAAAIGALGLACAAGLSAMLRRAAQEPPTAGQR
jgi:membrane-associated phospholipid phosphatase